MNCRLKELREAKKITQLNLSVKMCVTQQTISKIEQGKTLPRVELAYALSEYFNVSMDYLFGKSDKKYRIEHQIEIDKTIENFYDFFLEYEQLNDCNKETARILIRRLMETQS